MDDIKFKELYHGDWNLHVNKHIRKFMNNRFSDFGPGKNEYPTRMDICGCQLRVIYYGFSGTYMYYINGATNGVKYQRGYFLIDKIIRELKKAAEVKNGLQR